MTAKKCRKTSAGFDCQPGGASRFLSSNRLGSRLTTLRVSFGYVALKHLFKFCPQERGRDIFAVVQPCEQGCAAGGADPGNVAFAVGANLANVAQKGLRLIPLTEMRMCPDK